MKTKLNRVVYAKQNENKFRIVSLLKTRLMLVAISAPKEIFKIKLVNCSRDFDVSTNQSELMK